MALNPEFKRKRIPKRPRFLLFEKDLAHLEGPYHPGRSKNVGRFIGCLWEHYCHRKFEAGFGISGPKSAKTQQKLGIKHDFA